MIKKIVILGIIVCSLLVSPTVTAVDAEGTIDDPLDDVLDENSEETSDAPNLDIDKITYERDGQTVTIKLTVKGIIEDKGILEAFRFLIDDEYRMELEEKLLNLDPEDPDDLKVIEEYTEMFMSSYICYWFTLITKENSYNISYVNEEYIIKDTYSTGTMQGNVDVDGNDLTVSFDLLDSGDRLVNLTLLTMEVEIDYPLYLDEASTDCNDAAASSGSSSSSKTPGFEMIAVLVAIAIAFIILRRKKQ